MKNEVIIIYESIYNGNTEKIARAMAQKMGCRFIQTKHALTCVCAGCGKCATVCPLNVIKIENAKAIPVYELDCTLCRLCIKNCSERAIHLHYSWRGAIKVAKRHGKKVSL